MFGKPLRENLDPLVIHLEDKSKPFLKKLNDFIPGTILNKF